MDARKYIEDGYALLQRGDADGAQSMFWRIISSNSVTDNDKSDAYVGLGCICALLAPGMDGGYNGIYFFCTATIYNPSNRGALLNIVNLSDQNFNNRPIDYSLKKWASSRLKDGTIQDMDQTRSG